MNLLNLLKPNRFWVYLVVELLVIVAVTLIFKALADQIKIAAVLAGTLFCLMPLAFLFFEIRISKIKFKMWIVSLMVFLLFFAIPMLFMRLMHWNEDFQAIQIWGMPGPEFHKISRWSYIAMISATVVAIFQENRSKPLAGSQLKKT